MSQFKTYKFRDHEEMELFLNGGIIAGAPTTGGKPGLVGRNLVFTLPSVALCTFVAGALPNDLLSFADIKDQIETALAAAVVVKPLGPEGRLSIVEDSPGYGVALSDMMVSSVDITSLNYPADLTGLTVIVDGLTCSFGIGAPANKGALITALGVAFAGYTITEDAATHVIKFVKTAGGTITVGAGTANTVLGLTPGAWLSARELLGFAEDATGLVYQPLQDKNNPPMAVSFWHDSPSNSIILVTYE